MKCRKCQAELFLPFRCPYCGESFCPEHRLPENHECPRIEQARLPIDETQTVIVKRQKPYEYEFTYVPVRPKRERTYFSIKEIKHLTVAALLVIGIGLSLVFFSDAYAKMREPFMMTMFVTILTMSFLMHEIAHKVTAQRKGLWAEFRLTIMGAILTLLSIFPLLFKIISPGAVMIAGMVDRDNIGKISIAGPSTNIALSTVFLSLALLSSQHPFILVFSLAAAINAWIALFNLIPFGVLDGLKIFMWDKRIWGLAFSASLVLTLISYKLLI